MEKLNGFFDGIAKPLSGVADWLLRLGLGIAFFCTGMERQMALRVIWAQKEYPYLR